MAQIIMHIDVNSAYLSWTSVENLKKKDGIDLRKIPAIIGGDQSSRHGVVLAKSIPAKAYGIHTGEPVANAFRKCPNLVMQAPDHHMYHEKSHALMEYLHTWTPDIEQVSVDECYLDYTGIEHLYGEPVAFAHRIKDEVRQRFGFTVNIGISSVKLLAKMASDFQKPDRVHTLFMEEIETKMWPLPVSELFMAGKSTVDTLKKLEIRTIGDLAKSDPRLLELHLKKHGRKLWEYANGIDDSKVISEDTQYKGVGNSTTLSKDVTTQEEACQILLWLSEKVAGRLKRGAQKAGMVSVEIKYSDFTSVSHQKQLQKNTVTGNTIYKSACELFEELWDGKPIRLLGVRTSKLVDEDAPEQMNLFEFVDLSEREYVIEQNVSPEPELKLNKLSEDMNVEVMKKAQSVRADEKHKRAEEAAEKLREKFGTDVVKKGGLL